MSDDGRKTVPEQSIEVTLMIERFAAMAEGDVVTYGEVGKLIGRDLTTLTTRNRFRGHVATAINRVLRDRGIHVANVARVGWTRLPPSDAAGRAPATVRSIGRKIHKARVWLGRVDVARLTPEQRVKFAVGLTQIEMIGEVTTGRGAKRIEAEVAKGGKPKALPVGAALDLFK